MTDTGLVAGPLLPRAARSRPVRVVSLVALAVSAVAPGIIALSEGASAWALAGVLPLVTILVILMRDHDRHIEQAARRLVVVERERARLAESVKHVVRAFGSGLDLHALADVMAQTAADALDARRALVRMGDHDAFGGGPADASLDNLLDLVAESAVGGRTTTFLHSAATGHHAIAHPLREGAGVLAVARSARAFTEEEQGLLAWLGGQAAVSVENVALHERLVEQAQVDDLTGLGNQRVFHEALARELDAARHVGVPVSLILVDLDDFKAVNDRHGHPSGDRVLAAAGHAVRGAVRTSDTVARWGGEEFAVILPHTDADGAALAAESVREAVSRVRVPVAGGAVVSVTASVGVAASPGSGGDPEALYALADQALYEAKQRGKDRVAVAGPGVHVRVMA